MEAHVATLSGTAQQLNEFAARLQTDVTPVIRERAGFIESITLIDPATGEGLLITLWEDRSAAQRSSEQWRAEGASRGVSEAVGLNRSARWYNVAALTRPVAAAS